jgi:hypothetical protein
VGVDIAAKLAEYGLRSALIIDDAYELPSAAKISAEAKARFIQNVRDDEAGAAALRESFEGLDTEVDDQLSALLGNDESVQKIWGLYQSDMQRFGCCKAAFEDFEMDAGGKRASLKPLETYLNSVGVPFLTGDKIPAPEAISAIGLVFIDFYLVEGEGPEQALVRITEIGKKFSDVRQSADGKRFRPLVFLISSRPETAEREKGKFREHSHIKGSFFRFVKKANLTTDAFLPRLQYLLQEYEAAMALADYMDGFRSGALAAINKLEALELTELSLLHVLRIQAENERLGNYLNWIFSEAISGHIQSDDNVRERAGKLDKLQSQAIDGDIVAPRNTLFDIYANAVFRYDVRDRAGEGRMDPVAFGDIFLMHDVGEKATYITVMHPACAVIRPKPGMAVFCVLGTSPGQGSSDIQQFLRQKLFDNDRHLIQVPVGDAIEFRIIDWDQDHVRTVPIADLNDPAKYRRVARFQPLFAHQLNEAVLRRLGSVGVPVTPSILQVLDADVVLNVNNVKHAYTTKGQGYFAAVSAMKRDENKDVLTIRFTLAFINSLKGWATERLAAANDDKAKLEEIIKICEGPDLAEIEAQKPDKPISVGNRIKVFYLKELGADDKPVCGIVVKAVE